MIYKTLIRPWLFNKQRFPDPEDAHNFVLEKLRSEKVLPFLESYERLLDKRYDYLEQKLWGMHFSHPIGLAAGFDKNGVALYPLVALLGVSFIELGGITRFGQAGNPRPRIFRSLQDRALINRMGFNNEGADAVAARLQRMCPLPVPLGLNVGKSKDTPIDQAELDYQYTVRTVGPYVDYFTVNVSSPNTPDLRMLQEKKRLSLLLVAVKEESVRLPRGTRRRPRPVLVKLAPDLSPKELDEALEVADKLADGVVAANTTLAREGLINESFAREMGGSSGQPLQQRALEMVCTIRRKLPTMPIIGVGGIFNGDDALRMLETGGANLVQVYTGIIYEGPGMVRRSVKRLDRCLSRREEDLYLFCPRVNRD